MDAFLADKAPAPGAAGGSTVGNPHYGERWGRQWLDVARYADTKGYVFQEDRNYPNAYTYRDWVVRSLNEDLPYDQFLIDQIAADRLPLGDDKARSSCDGVPDRRPALPELAAGHHRRSDGCPDARHPGHDSRLRPLPRSQV